MLANTHRDPAVQQRLERWIQERPDLERLMWRDPVLVAGCLTSEYTLGVEREVLEFFSTHPAVKNISAERKELLARALAEKLDLQEVQEEVIFPALGLEKETEENGRDGDFPGIDAWPVLDKDALYGLAGDVVKAIDPYTEADPVAVLSNTLVMFGNAVGAGPHFKVEHTRHYLRLFIAQGGKTSKARKGQGMSTPRYLFSLIDPDWNKERITYGLSSGEGLINEVRDARMGVKDGKEVVVDRGVDDKRLLLVEEELSGPLKVMSREGNTLSVILRQAWDTDDLHPLTKNNPIRATGAHISLIGHITRDELLRHLTETEQSNGFANRFLWLLVRRSKVIDDPQGVPQEKLEPLVERLKKALDFARKVEEMKRDEEAKVVWSKVYPELSEGKPGLFGSIIARAEAQVMRLACIYALMDCSACVCKPHLEAALALWDYSETSARLIFGERLGDPTADRVLDALRNAPSGLSETEISYLFNRHKSASEISRALEVLQRAGLASPEIVTDTGGRPRVVWRAAKKAK